MQRDSHSLSTNRYLLLSILVFAIFVVIFAVFANELVEQELYRFDKTIINYVQSFIYPQLTSIMKFFTLIGSTVMVGVLVIIAAGLMFLRRKRWEALFLIIAVAGGGLFNSLLKWIFHRQRPTLHRLIEASGYSFPSGHSMGAMVFYGMVGMLIFMFLQSNVPKAAVALITVFMIFMIGISRIYLGVHYPSDVLAGYAAGGAWLVICLMALKLVLVRRGRGKKIG